MAAALAASLIDFVLGLTLGPSGPGAGNRVSLEGLTFGAKSDGALEIAIRKLEAASLRLASGPFALSAQSTGEWSLGPLAEAAGTIRAKIVDAHLLFDADVTVPIKWGRVDFTDATVEHVGPDSRMGVSRMGLYVDAPNGRSYLYQFSSPPVAGVEYERRGMLPGPFAVTDRGSLKLQPFGEWLLRQPPATSAMGFTEQARLLFERTSVSGDLQLGDGKFAAPGMRADMTGRADGRNAVRLHSEAVGRGITAEMASLSVRNAVLDWKGTQLGCDEITGVLKLRLFVEGANFRFELDVDTIRLSGLRVQLQRPPSV